MRKRKNYYQVHKNKTPRLLVTSRRKNRTRILINCIDNFSKAAKKVADALDGLSKSHKVITMPENALFRFVTMRTQSK